jgi:hypothetical protein
MTNLKNISLSDKLIDDLSKIKFVNGYRIVFKMLSNLDLTDDDLCLLLNRNKTSVLKDIQKLIDLGIIKRWKHEVGLTINTLHPKFFDLEDKCFGCKFSAIEEKNKVVLCYKKGLPCYNDYERIVYGLLRTVKAGFKSVDELQTYNRKFCEKREYRHVDQWINKDFVSFFILKFKEVYPTLVSPDSDEVRKSVYKAMNIFIKNAGKHWRRLYKQYILNMFRNFESENRVLHSKRLLDTISINKFLIDFGRKISKVEFCNIKGIHCSYCLVSKCSLAENGIECTDSIVNKMKDKYN